MNETTKPVGETTKPVGAPEKSPEVLALERELAEEQAAIATLDQEAETKVLRERLENAKRERLEKELIKRFEAEHGKFGRAFAMHAASTGPVFFARKEQVIFRRFSKAKKLGDEELQQFVTPCVIYPTREEFLEIADREPGTWISIANKLSYLYGTRKEDLEGKS